MSIDSTWLRCPNCLRNLAHVEAHVFGCEAGHRFDRAKHGYLTLLAPRAPRIVGDDHEMLAARASLLEGGAYAPIAEALVETVQSTLPSDTRSPLRIADLGCGTGYYSSALHRALPEAEFLLVDRSPDAVRRSLRALPDATGVVLDIWRPLPVRDAAVDIALNVFAPRNGAEFARILRRDGRLFVIVPTDAHLRELRIERSLLEVPAGKAEHVGAQLAENGLIMRSVLPVEYTLETDASTRALLAGMGPSAHHAARLSSAGDAEATRAVTVSVQVLVFEHAPTVA
jgi:23S rRNA (guanine745-N1)-methyltransferase